MLVVVSFAIVLAAPARAELAVVVTSKPVHALVAGVMGEAGRPALLIEAPVSPHSYSMRPSDAQKVHRANVFFRVSEALEPFTARLVKSLPATVRVVTLASAPRLVLLDQRRGGAFETGVHTHGHGKTSRSRSDESAGSDPHVWLDPANAKAMVRYTAEVLAEAAPEHAAAFAANAAQVSAKIDDLTAEIQDRLKRVAGRPFVVYHDATQYFEKRFGLAAAGAITVSPDVPPSAKRLSELRGKLASLGAACVFAEPAFDPKVTQAVREGTGTRTATLDPEGLALPAGPDLYFTLMRNLAVTIADCLAGGA
jgi:zinc transport system substrate-binding protein